jgi:A/G-specific adenine glycosylase
VTPFARELLGWFTGSQRLLPWREARTPYRVWVSEAMLQQTQVETVIPYFERWLTRFPTLEALAAAPLSEVLKAWEGLGYYRRARLLHEGAKVVVARHGGALPKTYDALLKLPGIGPYTAAAIASLAFGEPVLAVDGNVKRVAARLFRLTGDVKVREVETHLGPHLPETEAGAFNEALMELGATVCTPRVPRCETCPVRPYCKAFQFRQVTLFPEPKKRRKMPQLHRFALVHKKDTTKDPVLWLRERDESEMLGGLWGFVLSETEPVGEKLEPVRHAYTHFKITATPVVVETPPRVGRWVSLAELETLPLSRLDHKILERLHQKPVTLTRELRRP